MALALADRFDSIVGLFALGLAPTGSSDPYGLRRAALGIVRILIEKERSLPLSAALQQAAAALPVDAPGERLAEARVFISERLRGIFLAAGIAHDVYEAVVSTLADDPYAAYRTAQALNQWVKQNDWLDTLTAYARCKRIIRPLAETYDLRPERLTEPASAALLATYQQVSQAVRAGDLAARLEGLRQALWMLRSPINQFFTDVLVMDKDPDIRAARLGLVQAIAQLPDGLADLSKLRGF